MKTSEKLQLILSLSGLTQEGLARKLGVTFVTLNSWVNARSSPRAKAQLRIDGLLAELFGTPVPDSDILTVKKELVAQRASGQSLLKLLALRSDLMDQCVLALTYNTNSIEGSTLTEAETAAVLFDDIALSNRTLTEQIEAKNHRAALMWLFDVLPAGYAITETMILKMHAMLMNGIRDDAGSYRNHAVRIVGANVPTANFVKVPELMKILIKEMNVKNADAIAHTSEIHARFEQIHPFADGNGRIGRLLIQAMVLRHNIAPALILKKQKQAYIRHLNAAQLKGEMKGLEEFLCDAVLKGHLMFEIPTS